MYRYMAFWDFALGNKLKTRKNRRTAKRRRKHDRLVEQNALRESLDAADANR